VGPTQAIVYLLGKLYLFVKSTPENVLAGLVLFLGWVLDLGIALCAWLPDHTPIEWPDPAAFGLFFAPLGYGARFVHLPFVLPVMALIVFYHMAVLLYSALRAVYGLFPMVK
jgi:hypothetical protein